MVDQGRALLLTFPAYCVNSHLLISPLLFLSLWLWATLSGNGLYFLADGTCAAGNNSGENGIVGEKEQIEIRKEEDRYCERN